MIALLVAAIVALAILVYIDTSWVFYTLPKKQKRIVHICMWICLIAIFGLIYGIAKTA